MASARTQMERSDLYKHFRSLFNKTFNGPTFREKTVEAFDNIYGRNSRPFEEIIGVLKHSWGLELEFEQWKGSQSSIDRGLSGDHFYITMLFWLFVNRTDEKIGQQCLTELRYVVETLWERTFEGQCEFKEVPNLLELEFNSADDKADPNLKPLVIIEPDEDGGNWLNPFNLTSITLQGRDEELARLRAFSDDDSTPYRLWALIASSGAGKTRLAAEWMFECREEHGWNVGFLGNPDPGIWKDWRPSANTLIAVDYIHNYGRAIKAILNRCKTLHDEGGLDAFKVRILAIDHVFPERFADILLYSHWNEVFENKIELDVWNQVFGGQAGPGSRKSVFFEELPLRLAETQDRTALLRLIVADVGGKLAIDDERVDAAMETLDKMEDAARHPLFAALIGDAIYNGQKDFRTWDRLELIDYYLDGKNRLPWEKDNDPFGFWVGSLVSVATICGGADDSTLSEFLPDTIIQDGAKTTIAEYYENIESQYSYITSSLPIEGRLEAFRPDILGEFFVLLFLGQIRRSRTNREIFIAMLSVSGSDRDGEKWITAMLGFFERLTRNLCNYDQSADRIKTFWANLDVFLDPRHFLAGTDARYAISIIRANIAEELGRRQFHARRARFLKKVRFDDLTAAVDGWMALSALLALLRHYEWSEQTQMNGSTIRDITVEAALRFDREFSATFSSMDVAMEARQGRLVVELLKGGWAANIAQNDRDLAHTLTAAAYYGYANVVERILTKGVSPNITVHNGIFPLLMAAQEGNGPVVDILLQNEKIDVNNTHMQTGSFPLLMAAQAGHAPVVEALLRKDGIDINKTNKEDGNFPLLMAAQNGWGPVVEALLQKTDIDVNKTHKQSGAFPLLRAAQTGNPAVVDVLLQKEGINVNKTNKQTGSFPLLIAAQVGHTPVVEALLRKEGINVNKTNKQTGTFPLLMAAQAGHAPVVDALIEKEGINVNKIGTEFGATALMFAVVFNRGEIVSRLLHAEAVDPNVVSNDYGTALDLAILENHEDIKAMLIEAGAKTEAELKGE